jgi:retinol dehydrogenase-8
MASKVVLITGCSTGVGKNLAVLLAGSKSPAYRVYATMRNLSKQEALVTAAGSLYNNNLFVHQLDVSNDGSVEKAVSEIVDKEGRIDVLVNNAGQGLAGPLETQSSTVINTTLDINLTGVIRVTKVVLPHMKAKESGQIIQVTSAGGLNGVPFNDIYCAAKFGVEGFSESLAPLLRAFNIKINMVEPGPIATEFVANCVKEKLNIDTKTQAIYEGYQAEMAAGYKPEIVQTGQQVAEIIKGIIEDENAPFRNQTNPFFKPGDMKFKDPTGNVLIQATYDRFLKKVVDTLPK